MTTLTLLFLCYSVSLSLKASLDEKKWLTDRNLQESIDGLRNVMDHRASLAGDVIAATTQVVSAP